MSLITLLNIVACPFQHQYLTDSIIAQDMYRDVTMDAANATASSLQCEEATFEDDLPAGLSSVVASCLEAAHCQSFAA